MRPAPPCPTSVEDDVREGCQRPGLTKLRNGVKLRTRVYQGNRRMPLADIHRQLWFLNTLHTVRVSHDEGEDGISVMESLAPHGDSPPLHVDRTEDEIFHVLDGELRVRAGDSDGEDRRRRDDPRPEGRAAHLPRRVARGSALAPDDPTRRLRTLRARAQPPGRAARAAHAPRAATPSRPTRSRPPGSGGAGPPLD